MPNKSVTKPLLIYPFKDLLLIWYASDYHYLPRRSRWLFWETRRSWEMSLTVTYKANFLGRAKGYSNLGFWAKLVLSRDVVVTGISRRMATPSSTGKYQFSLQIPQNGRGWRVLGTSTRRHRKKWTKSLGCMLTLLNNFVDYDSIYSEYAFFTTLASLHRQIDHCHPLLLSRSC